MEYNGNQYGSGCASVVKTGLFSGNLLPMKVVFTAPMLITRNNGTTFTVLNMCEMGSQMAKSWLEIGIITQDEMDVAETMQKILEANSESIPDHREY